MSAEVRQYVPACLQRISPPHWVRARNAASIRQAYRIVKEVEDHLPFPWPEPIEAMGEEQRARRQVPVDIQRQVAWTVEEARERARLLSKGEKFSPSSTVRKFRGGQPPIKQHRVEPKDIKVVRVTLPPKAKAEPIAGYVRRMPKCYIGRVMEDGTYEYGPGRQPELDSTVASEATSGTSAEFYARNQQDFDKWEELCDA